MPLSLRHFNAPVMSTGPRSMRQKRNCKRNAAENVPLTQRRAKDWPPKNCSKKLDMTLDKQLLLTRQHASRKLPAIRQRSWKKQCRKKKLCNRFRQSAEAKSFFVCWQACNRKWCPGPAHDQHECHVWVFSSEGRNFCHQWHCPSARGTSLECFSEWLFSLECAGILQWERTGCEVHQYHEHSQVWLLLQWLPVGLPGAGCSSCRSHGRPW